MCAIFALHLGETQSYHLFLQINNTTKKTA